MSLGGSSDYRDELYVSALRCLTIVRELAYTKKGQPILTVDKAALFDCALRNPSIVKRIVRTLNPTKTELTNAPEVLYPDNTDYGEPFNKRQFLHVAMILKENNLINIERIEGEFYLMPTEQGIKAASGAPPIWSHLLAAIRTIAAKPISVLQKSALREA